MTQINLKSHTISALGGALSLMEDFKKNLLKMGKTNRTVPAILLIAAVFFLLFGIFLIPHKVQPFDPTSGGYASLNIVYVMGPFAEQTSDGRTVKEYYVAENDKGYWSIVSTESSCPFPVYNETISDADLKTLVPQTAVGQSKKIPKKLAAYIVDYFNNNGFELSLSDYEQTLGDHYLDTTAPLMGSSLVLFTFAAVFFILSVIVLISFRKNGNHIQTRIQELMQNGEFEPLCQDFQSADAAFYDGLGLAVSPHYLLDFSNLQYGFSVYPLDQFYNVFKCNMVNGNPTTSNYIALEHKNGQRILVAACPNVSKDFNAALDMLKQSVNGGMQW